jgi:hypothetical protein
MSYPNLKTNHIQEALDFLPTQFSDAQHFQKLVTVAMEQVQGIENTIADIYYYQMLNNASGAQLDALGEIAGEARGTSTDAEYLARIRARIAYNRSSGCADTLLDMIKTQRGVLDVHLEEFPGIVYITVISTFIPEDPFIFLIKKVAAAGVRVIVSYIDVLVPFVLSDANDSEDPAFGGGLADYNNPSAEDGILVSVVN